MRYGLATMHDFSVQAAANALQDIALSDPSGVQNLARSIGSVVFDIPGIKMRKIAEFNGMFYFSDKRPMQRVLRQISKAKGEVEAMLKCPPICLLLDFDCRETYINTAVRPLSGFGFIRFINYQPHYREILHEVAHCAAYSKFALLDEGIAFHAESHISGNAHGGQRLPFISVKDLCDLPSDMALGDALDSYRQFDFYHIAGRIVGALIDHCGAEKLCRFVQGANFLSSGDDLYEALLMQLGVAHADMNALLNLADEPSAASYGADGMQTSLSTARDLLINGDVELAAKLLVEIPLQDASPYMQELQACASVVHVLSHPQRDVAFQLFPAIQRVLSPGSAYAQSPLAPALEVYRRIFNAMEAQEWGDLSRLADSLGEDYTLLGDPTLQTAIYAKLLLGSHDIGKFSAAMRALSDCTVSQEDANIAVKSLIERFERALVFLAPQTEQMRIQ